MNCKSIEQELKKVQLKKKDLITMIKDEKETLQYLAEHDRAWSYFILNELSSINASSEGISDEEYDELRTSQSDLYFIDNLNSMINGIHMSNGTKYYKKMNVTVGAVCDTDFYNTFKDTVSLHLVNVDYNSNDLEKYDVIVISNINKQLAGDWNKFDVEETKVLEILGLVKRFKKINKPVVFYDQYNEQDPYFNLLIARECDQIFTTTEEKYALYAKECPSRTQLTPYAVNPLLHNPVGISDNPKLEGVLYQGYWDQRNKTLENILDGVNNIGIELKIIDRGFSCTNKLYRFPLKYLPFISPSDGKYNYDLHKLFDYSVVNNDIEKVYQLQAMSNVIFSTYHPTINNNFPNVFTVDTRYEIGKLLDALSKKDKQKIQLEGIRNIMSRYLCYENMEHILKSVGIKCSVGQKNVLIVGRSNTQSEEQYQNQSYKHCEFLDQDNLTPQILDKFDFIAYFDPDYYYDEYYIEDLINGFKYTKSDFVVKSDNNENNFSYTNRLPDFNKAMLCVDSFDPNELINKRLYLDKPYSGFNIDNCGVNEVELEVKTESHYNEKLISVIIPIYNNGKFLEYKCFESLKRSSIFDKMEIIFVDDGSTDKETSLIVDRLYKSYKNIKLYRFHDGGSGSASRPRNKGIEISTCKYITFLDPDNEAVNDGYAQLLNDIVKDPDLDLVVGNITRYDNSLLRKEVNYYKAAYDIMQSDVIDEPKELLKKSNLKVQSIQALVLKKEIVERNNLKMVESAAGQDTLFFQQLLTEAKKIKIVDLNIHIYYAAVDNSVTNTVTSKFYEKYFKLEIERIKFLKDNGLFDIYMNKKFTFYFINWYLKKLTSIKEGEEKKALLVLNSIYEMYEPYINESHKLFKVFRRYIKKERYNEFVLYCKDYFKKG